MKKLSIPLASTFLILVIHISAARSSDAVATAGDVGQIAIPSAGLAMTYAYKDRDGRKELLEAYASAIAVMEGLKYTVHERRPNGSQHSFPSGHTTSAFAGAAFIQQRYGWEPGIPAYAAASFVGYSRVESRNHYWHDVLAGALIGVAANAVFVTPDSHLAFTPVVGGGFYGFVAKKGF